MAGSLERLELRDTSGVRDDGTAGECGSDLDVSVALASFLAIDAVFLKFFMLPLFSQYIGDMLREETRLFVAFGFYALFVAALIYLAVVPALAEQNVWRAVKNGAVVGFISYGTYEATNMATLRGWAWPMLTADIRGAHP